MARVSLEGVSKVFARGVAAVNNLSLEVQDHEFLVLVGPSGCGKSTTLRLIAGLDRPTSGVIHIGKQNVEQVAARHRNVALVFQNQPLYPHLTVAKNLAFGLRNTENKGAWLASIGSWWGRPKGAESAAERSGLTGQIREAARGLGVEHLLDRLPRQLSGGERQRVALGRAIVRNPAVFLLDEPLSNLDANLRIELRRLVRQIHDRSQAATMYVTHDQAEALALADRVAVMERGELRQVGPPLEVYDEPANRFVASFIGNPPMNLVEGRLVERDGKWLVDSGGLAIELTEPTRSRQSLEKYKEQEVVCGLRAEHLEVVPVESGHGRVCLVERWGDESWLHITTEKFPESKLVGKTKIRTTLRPGDAVTVSCAAARAHWFDRKSGVRIT